VAKRLAAGATPVLVWEDGDRSRAQFVGGSERANRDLAAVGDKNLAEHP